ncbi:: hypothetical protein [Arcticibacter svalbardensis MN12-7]|uniref:Alpha-2-macroglobulin domain protein n=1 Tax=Arcticibacter svalbardensis MN12-7 TaxID=1150600 RepID=R9GPE5_9SPHI|nr:MG2 domain-containing protein [Arcticibacter svalbardensis]EOR93588.1 : hypothetical protein [Arcticibacter svalbardensis MN12-7]
MANTFYSKKNIISIITALGLIILAFVTYLLLKPNPTNENNPEFAAYIESYTSGVISKSEKIKIHLTGQVNTLHRVNEPLGKDILDFSPAIKGKAYWLDESTIEFAPAESLKPGESYQASFHLGKLVEVKEPLQTFIFNFEIIKPSFKIELDGLKSINSSSLAYLKCTGTILTSDQEETKAIEKVLIATYAGKSKGIKWEHHPEMHTSRFTVDSIEMGQASHALKLSWNGTPIHSNIKDNKELEVPAKGVFKVLDMKAVQKDEQYVLIQLSNPVMIGQDLNGLITISNITDPQFTIEGSEIKVYTPDRLNGNYTVSINEGIQNIASQKLKTTLKGNVSFENIEPAVTIPGKGMIIPDSGKLSYPFEAINLKAVDVTIIKIYENNIPQFLQVNNATDGSNDLRRVGKPLVQKTIRLDEDKTLNLKKKNRFALDIDKLIKTEPGAIYRITIGFRKSYSLYKCTDQTEEESPANSYDYGEKIDEDDEFWQRYNDYYPFGYDWDEKDDPCSNSYFNQNRWVSRNVIASNIGIITKRGDDNTVTVFTTDILTTEPMQGVEIKLLDYQNQLIQTANTNNDGIAVFQLKRKPFLLLAKKDKQRGYLKLDDGSSLPLSRFNVSGDIIQNGIKGFIYGERGVWRPGDSIYLSFILEDKDKKLPDGLPIIFELYTPQGQLNKKLMQTKGVLDFYTFKVNTNSGAPTGNWLAKVKVGGSTFSKAVKIETIMPNRLKINLNFASTNTLIKGKDNPGKLTVNWLFGSIARNLKAKVDVTLSPAKTSFKGFEPYTFDDPTNAFESESTTIFDGKLNDNGIAIVKANLSSTESAPGVLRANFITKVFEPGGNFSIDNFEMPYHIYNSYTGINVPQGAQLSDMLLTDRNHQINIINVNTAGKYLAGTQQVEIQLYKIQWRWWWDEGEENLSNFSQNKVNQLLKKEIITLNNGKGNWNFRINYPEWGRYLIRVKDLKSGHTSGQTLYVDWPGWAQREQQNNPTEASMLSFTANKESFKVGENVELTIPSSKGGRGLVSVESGSKVLKTWWIETQKGQTKFSFKVEKEMAPNVFLNVTLLQPHSQTINDLPIRMYGVIPILVEDPKTILKPVIGSAAVIRPETNSSLTVSEQSGRPMTYTIAIVDEGLLALTKFNTPNPHSSFYAREALGVKTWDLFDNVIGAWGGDLVRILSIGGDASINRNVNPAKANRFKPVVKFMGPFYLKEGQKTTHHFKLPQYIGAVRAMVIAGKDGAYGFAEKQIQVKKPLMILATLPRVAGPGETFKLPITVFAMENQIKNVKLEIKTSNLLNTSSSSQVISFSGIGEKMAYATIAVKQATGIAKIKIIATSGNEKAEYDVEMDIRNPNPYLTVVTGAQLEPKKSYSKVFAPIGISGSTSSMLEVSTIPAMNLSKRLNYLIQYPHGCVEQVVSGIFPQLVLNQLTDVSPQQKAAIERNIKSVLNRLQSFQTQDGGMAYWPGNQDADEWGTNYAGHFLLEAQRKGYSLPAGLWDSWKRYQKNKANAYAPSSSNFYGGDLIQAYRLYLLAFAKSPEVGAMNRLREFSYLSDAAKWRLAAAYKLIGQTDIALSLIKNLSLEVKPYNQMSYTYGSDLRDEAMILETLTELGKRKQAAVLVNKIAAMLSKDQWYSTQTTAYSLIAISKYCGVNKDGKKMNFSYSINGAKQSITSNSYIKRFPLNYKAGKSALQLLNNGDNVLYIRVTQEGQAAQGQNPPLVNHPELLDMGIVYKTQNGMHINPVSIKQGTDFIAEVTINNPGKRGYYEQMALTQIFPSGWEIINTRLSDQSGNNSGSNYTYRDIRDDRVLTYFNIKPRETLTYQVLLNASYLGRFYLPAVSSAAMYDNEIQASKTGFWVEVVK